MISNQSTNDTQLLELKVKHLRSYLQAKDISHNTCTEKRELVDLIKQNRQKPFTRLFNQQSNNNNSSTSQQNKSGPFSTFQNTVSSFANQVNSFASNIQDYVSNTVSDVIHTIGDEPTNTSLPPPPQASASRPPPPPPQASASRPPPPPPQTSASRRPPPPSVMRLKLKKISSILFDFRRQLNDRVENL